MTISNAVVSCSNWDTTLYMTGGYFGGSYGGAGTKGDTVYAISTYVKGGAGYYGTGADGTIVMDWIRAQALSCHSIDGGSPSRAAQGPRYEGHTIAS